jgi:hypothetical protein
VLPSSSWCWTQCWTSAAPSAGPSADPSAGPVLLSLARCSGGWGPLSSGTPSSGPSSAPSASQHWPGSSPSAGWLWPQLFPSRGSSATPVAPGVARLVAWWLPSASSPAHLQSMPTTVVSTWQAWCQRLAECGPSVIGRWPSASPSTVPSASPSVTRAAPQAAVPARRPAVLLARLR